MVMVMRRTRGLGMMFPSEHQNRGGMDLTI